MKDAARLQLPRIDLDFNLAQLLMHGYKFPHHEQRLEEIAKSVGFTQVSLARNQSVVKLISRGDTSVADAALSPNCGDTSSSTRRIERSALASHAIEWWLADACIFAAKQLALRSGRWIVGAAAIARRQDAQTSSPSTWADLDGCLSHFRHLRHTTEAVLAGVRIKNR